ncbi:dihydropyrimidinase [bacterium]|nr:dihydropyrimidinase [bacterium]
MYDLVFRSARVVTPNRVILGDLGVTGERISAIGPNLGPGKEEVDATGKLLFPGFIDAHVHLGVPIRGTESVDGVTEGSRAAAFGGVTTMIDFTVQDKGESLLDSFHRRRARIEGASYVDIALHANFTRFNEENLAQIPEVLAAGAAGLKIFTAYREAGMQMEDRQILRIAKKVGEAGGLLLVHAENGDAADYLAERLAAEGRRDAAAHGESRPDLLEAEAIFRVATLARIADCPLYVVHLSSARGLETIRRLRADEWKIFAETCPQYLLLDRSRYEGENGHRFIASPPLREKIDGVRLLDAILGDEIDVVATDHCPFSSAQKQAGGGDFLATPNGIGGVETLLPLMFTRLLALGENGLAPKHNAGLLRLVRVLAENPARIFGLAPRKGALKEDADADLVLYDPAPSRTLTAAEMHGGSDWDPYEGLEVRGAVESVWLRGKRIVNGEILRGRPKDGIFLKTSR